jgi:hypothetical protein
MTTGWDVKRWRAALAELDHLLPLSALEQSAHLAVLARRRPALAADVALLLREQRAANAEHFLEDEADDS